MDIYDFTQTSKSPIDEYILIPKEIIFNDKNKDLSPGAIILYGLFYERAAMANRDGLVDKDGRVYINFHYQEIMEVMHCSNNTAIKHIRELETHDLIERRKLGQGKPAVIYVKTVMPKQAKRKKTKA